MLRANVFVLLVFLSLYVGQEEKIPRWIFTAANLERKDLDYGLDNIGSRRERRRPS